MSNVIQGSFARVAPVSAPAIIKAPALADADYAGKNGGLILPVLSKDIAVDGEFIPGKKALMVDGQCVNIVSDRYEIHQPVDVVEQFQRVSNEFGLDIKKTLFNPKNGGLLISAKYSSENIIGDNHDINLTFYTSHCGKYKTFLTMDLLRMACMNQVPALYREKQRHIFAEKHYKNALDIRLLGDLLADIPTAINSHIETMNTLQSFKMSKAEFVEFCRVHWDMKKEQKQFQTKIDKLKSVYDNAPGQSHLDQSGYKAYNAITYLNTHNIRQTAMATETVMVKNSLDSIKAVEGLLAIA